MTKKVMLITGSSGRIGQVCAQRFADSYQVVGLDRHPAKKASIDHITMDISSDESVKEALEEVRKRYGNRIGPVIHLAAYYTFDRGRPELYETITVQGTKHLLDELQTFEVEQFLFSSTILVHAPCKIGDAINEKWPLEPKWDYPKSKVRTEKVIHERHGKIPAVIMRIAGCYDDQCHSIAIAHNIQRIYEHEIEAHLHPGDRQHGNPFLHLEDLVDAFELSLNHRVPGELILIIGENKTASYRVFQNRISELLNHKDFALFRVPKWVAKEGAKVQQKLPFVSDNFIQPWMIDIADDHYALDISRAEKTIGWVPKHNVLDTLPLMIELLKTNPLEWYRTNGLTPPDWLVKKVQEVRGQGLAAQRS